MNEKPLRPLRTETALGRGIIQMFRELEKRLEPKKEVAVYLAGGLGVYLYTGLRISGDIDAEFGARVLVPSDLMLDVSLENGEKRTLYFDTNYNPMFALLHEDYQQDARLMDIGTGALKVHLLSPVDLAVSKIARFQDNDREDIEALVREGLVTAREIEQRAHEALPGYIGEMWKVERNIDDAVSLAQKVEAERNEPCVDRGGEAGEETDKGR